MGKRFILYVLLLQGIGACSEQPSQPDGAVPARAASEQLSQAEAMARKARISEVAYVLDIDLVSVLDAYQGHVNIAFQLTDANAALELDFSGGSVSGVEVNGRTVAVDYNGYFITLPAEALLPGDNEVSVEYQHPFDQDGTGLHRFSDPEDDRTYIYSYLWPYYANRLFPAFDQPNLKASYELTVRAESDWQVVSATLEDAVTIEGDTSVWHFPETLPFSTYVFSLHAGPYQIWDEQAGDIPIRLLARQSQARYVAVEEWLEVTKAGLAFFQDYFDIPYPFAKYDQVIVPDFVIGAMENVAAVTFADGFVDRGASTRFSSQRRANTILHEMAHMWFGDLVTKDWWNGLWLNESFATLMASVAMAETTEFDDQWHAFYLGENLTAISADNAVSTHPIEMPVNSTSDFFMVFDDITYDKGASVLNQLSHYIGQENFRLGVSSYLKAHAYGNTELADFIYALSVQSDIDLTPWAQDWLYNAGVNTLEARFSCESGTVAAMSILQTASADYQVLREQRVQLGLFAETSAAGIEAYAAIPVIVSGAETPVPAAVGQPCPNLVYPNYQGWGYAEVKLDRASIDFVVARSALSKLDDPLLRSMLWTALIEATASRQFDDSTLLGMINAALDGEENDRIIRQIQDAQVTHLDLLERLSTQGSPDLPSSGIDYGTKLRNLGTLAENRLWELLQQGVSSTQGASLLNLRAGNYVQLARSDTALANLSGLLDGTVTVPGLQVQSDLRWRIIRHLAARGHGRAQELISAELGRDGSDAGRRAAIAAEAALPDLAIKQRWVEHLHERDEPLPLSHLRAAMSSLFPVGQEAMQLALLPQLTANLGALAAARDPYFLQSYGSNLFAGICSREGTDLLQAATVDPNGIGATLSKFMNENVQRAEACVDYGEAN